MQYAMAIAQISVMHTSYSLNSDQILHHVCAINMLLSHAEATLSVSQLITKNRKESVVDASSMEPLKRDIIIANDREFKDCVL